MSSNTLFLMELLIFNGVFLGWAAWELWSVRRSKDKDAKASPEDPGHPER